MQIPQHDYQIQRLLIKQKNSSDRMKLHKLCKQPQTAITDEKTALSPKFTRKTLSNKRIHPMQNALTLHHMRGGPRHVQRRDGKSPPKPNTFMQPHIILHFLVLGIQRRVQLGIEKRHPELAIRGNPRPSHDQPKHAQIQSVMRCGRYCHLPIRSWHVFGQFIGCDRHPTSGHTDREQHRSNESQRFVQRHGLPAAMISLRSTRSSFRVIHRPRAAQDGKRHGPMQDSN